MTLTTNFPPQTKVLLGDRAAQPGLPLDELIIRIVDERLHPALETVPPLAAASEDDTTSALLQSWFHQEAADDPEVIRKGFAYHARRGPMGHRPG